MKKAFTLIELLVIIAMIGIISIILLTSLSSCGKEEDITYTKEYCDTERFECRDKCANRCEGCGNLEDCLLKCEIKSESCMSKVGGYTTTNK